MTTRRPRPPWGARAATVAGASAALLAFACLGAVPVIDAPRSRDSHTSAAERRTDSPPSPTPESPSPGTPAGPAAPAPRIDALPTRDELAAARAEVARLDAATLAGSVLVIDYEGTDPAAAAARMRDSGAGGVILFGGNVPATPAARVPTLRRLSDAAAGELRRTGRTWPAVVAVDQEGGVVTRVGEPLTAFPAPMALGAAGSRGLARAVAEASARELRSAGVTLSFSPTVDVTDGRDAVIGTRSLGADPDAVGRLAAGMARGYADAGLVATAKHFPGHGGLREDSHLDSPRLDTSVAGLLVRDVAPYVDLLPDGLAAVMVGHMSVPALDPTGTPASLSRPVVTGFLRERLGFRGLVVTDSLRMGAVGAYVGKGPAAAGASAVQALAAGADVVLMPEDPAAARAAIVEAMASRRLPRTRVEDAAALLVATMRHASARTRPAGADASDLDGAPPVAAAIGANAAIAQRLAARSIVQLGGTCGARLVGASMSVEGGTAQDRAGFVAAARRAGVRASDAGPGPSTEGRSSGPGGPGGPDVTGTPGVTRVALIGGPQLYAGTGATATAQATYADVVIATDNPLYLGMARARGAKLATFGRTATTWEAAMAVLLGRVRAVGKLPIAVDGSPLGSGC